MNPDDEGVHPIANTDQAERKADVVFLHGLAGASHSTWRHGEEGSPDHFFWPEALGKELPDCGIWSVGSAAGITGLGNPGMAIRQRAVNIGCRLVNLGVGERPVVFITHSMGGLIAKKIVSGLPEGQCDTLNGTNLRGCVGTFSVRKYLLENPAGTVT